MAKQKKWWAIGGALAALVLLLAACDGDDDKSPSPTATNGPAPTATYHTVGGVPTVPPAPPGTPYLMPSEPLFQEAGSAARIDLTTRLNISIEQIRVLEPDIALLNEVPLTCPEIEDDTITPYYVYVQYERFLYPYQFYRPAESETAVVEACDDVLTDNGVLFVPTPDARPKLLDAIRADLRERGVDSLSGTFEAVTPSTWMSANLGCPVLPGDPTPVPAEIPGFQIIYTLGTSRYEYHTDLTGEQIVYCAPPPAADSAENLIARLQNNAALKVNVVTGEVAVYNGLPAEGVLLTLTDEAFRVGVFGFATPAEAQLAAGMVNDERVSRIFVSGPVLIVQEENSLDVYSALQTLAEEVRTPILERQAAPTTEPGG
jgi:hypothetical protein